MIQQDTGSGTQACQQDDENPQGQDQVEARQREDGDANQHPERMVAVGGVDAVEGAAVALADVLRDLEVVIGVVAREPVVRQVVGVRKGSIAVDTQQGDHDDDFEPGQALQLLDEAQGVIRYRA